MENSEIFYRFVEIKDDAIDVEKRIIKFAFSSDTEEVRDAQGRIEILGHAEGEPNFEWANSGRCPLLNSHDANRQIGVVIADSVNSDGRVGRAAALLGTGPEAESVWPDIVSGVKRNLSVGYKIHERQSITPGKIRAVNWEVVEISLVSLPADREAYIGRNVNNNNSKKVELKMENENKTPEIDVEELSREVRIETRKEEGQRTKAVVALCDKYQMLDQAYGLIESGKSYDEIRSYVLDEVEKRTPQLKPAVLEPEVKREVNQSYSLARALTAVRYGRWDKAGFEVEVSDHLRSMTGIDAGFLAPEDILSTRASMAVANTGYGDDFVATVQGQEIPALFDKSSLETLGVTFLNGLTSNISMPTFGSFTAYNITDDSGSYPITESRAATDAVTMSPKAVGVLATVSEQLLRTSTPSIEASIKRQMRGTLLQKVQRDYFETIRGTSGIGNVVATSGVLSWEDLNTLIALVEAENIYGQTAYATNVKVANILANTAKVTSTDSAMIIDGIHKPIMGVQTELTNGVIQHDSDSTNYFSALYYADWSQSAVGSWNVISFDVSNSHGSNFALAHNSIRLIYFTDTAVMRPEAFAACLNVITGDVA